jgi:hypothetical protein
MKWQRSSFALARSVGSVRRHIAAKLRGAIARGESDVEIKAFLKARMAIDDVEEAVAVAWRDRVGLT